MKHKSNEIVTILNNYICCEILPRLPQVDKWVLGSFLEILTDNIEVFVSNIEKDNILNALGLVDNEGNIDTEQIIQAMSETAQKNGAISITVPFVGKMIFSANDVEKLRSYFQ